MGISLKTMVIASTILASSAAIAKTPILYEAQDIDAVCRVMYAEARSQGVFGKIAVVEVIINRLRSGRFGTSIPAVLEEKHQFEPVTKAGGKWQNLPSLTDAEYAECKQIIALKNGDDVSGGATYFQNADIVRERARRGQVRSNLVNFGGMPKTAEIDDHTFYSPVGNAEGSVTRISGGASSKKPSVARTLPVKKKEERGVASPFISRDISGMYITIEPDEVLTPIDANAAIQEASK